MTRNTEHLSWVLEHMPNECSKALAHFTESNPHWNGAHWDDCLDALLDADAGLEFTDPLFDMDGFDMDGFLTEHASLTGAITLTLVWADDDFRRHRTDEQRRTIVYNWMREHDVN